MEQTNLTYSGLDCSLVNKSVVVEEMPQWQFTLWSVVFSSLIAAAVVGNVLVVWIVVVHRKMQNATNYFIVNLSVADLIMALFNCAFNFAYMMQKDWTFGDTYCSVNNFVAHSSVAASVFTLTAVSFDRYSTVMHPFRPRITRRMALITNLFIWLLSFSLAVPCLLYSTTIPYSSAVGTTQRACVLWWPDGIAHYSATDYAYNITFLAVTYVVPVLCMALWYVAIGRILWAETNGDDLNETLESKRKVARMFIVLVSLFAVCWLPYHVYFLWAYYDHSVATYENIQHIYLAFYWIAMSSSVTNPIVYYILNARFRGYFRRIICFFNKNYRRDSL